MKRIIVVEDDPFIGQDLAEQLSDSGFDALGPVATCRDALDLVARRGCDCALLDVNLGPETSEAVALELVRRRIPFVTVSGYSIDQHPPVFRGSPTLTKPVRFARLLEELRKLTGTWPERPGARSVVPESPVSSGVQPMPRCDVCGNEYDKAFKVTQGARSMTFDSFECAIEGMAPRCAHCGCRVIGHGIEAGDKIFCCAHCAKHSGVSDVRDRTK